MKQKIELLRLQIPRDGDPRLEIRLLFHAPILGFFDKLFKRKFPYTGYLHVFSRGSIWSTNGIIPVRDTDLIKWLDAFRELCLFQSSPQCQTDAQKS